MHPAIELLLARMDSNPEEFDGATTTFSRWASILNQLLEHASKEENIALTNKIRMIRLDAIHKSIMKELCDPSGN